MRKKRVAGGGHEGGKEETELFFGKKCVKTLCLINNSSLPPSLSVPVYHSMCLECTHKAAGEPYVQTQSQKNKFQSQCTDHNKGHYPLNTHPLNTHPTALIAFLHLLA